MFLPLNVEYDNNGNNLAYIYTNLVQLICAYYRVHLRQVLCLRSLGICTFKGYESIKSFAQLSR